MSKLWVLFFSMLDFVKIYLPIWDFLLFIDGDAGDARDSTFDYSRQYPVYRSWSITFLCERLYSDSSTTSAGWPPTSSMVRVSWSRTLNILCSASDGCQVYCTTQDEKSRHTRDRSSSPVETHQMRLALWCNLSAGCLRWALYLSILTMWTS